MAESNASATVLPARAKGDAVAAGVDRRRALQLLGGLGAAGFAAACGRNEPDSPPPEEVETARIGLLVPGTGGYKPLGDDMINGFERYLRRSGRELGGHPVETMLVDEGDSADSATSALQRLLDDDVHAVVGVASSVAMLPVSERIEEEHIPLLGANASPEGMPSTPHVWRTSYVNHEPGLAMGRHLADAIDGPVAIIAPDEPMGTDAIAGLEQAFGEAEATALLTDPILTATVTQPARDHFAGVLQQVRDQEPAAVFACYAGTAAVEFVRQYLEAGLDPAQLYGPAYLTEGVVLQTVGEDAVGIRTASNYATELRTAANRAFAADYRRDFGDSPTIYAVAAYDAAAALDKAIGLSGDELDPHEINVNLAKVGLIDSPRGRWQFNQVRSPTQKWYLREVNFDGPVLSNVVLKELGTLG